MGDILQHHPTEPPDGGNFGILIFMVVVASLAAFFHMITG